MNNVYFACTDCKVFVDAGYRWAGTLLEVTGIVARNKTVNVESVLSAREYWSPPNEPDSNWLIHEVLPSVRVFLFDHRNHKIIYGESEAIYSTSEEEYEWLQIGYSAVLNPRYVVEILKMSSWNQVLEHIKGLESPPFWSEDEESYITAKKKFEELVQANQAL